jgi:beta-1,4-mannosyltransferase
VVTYPFRISQRIAQAEEGSTGHYKSIDNTYSIFFREKIDSKSVVIEPTERGFAPIKRAYLSLDLSSTTHYTRLQLPVNLKELIKASGSDAAVVEVSFYIGPLRDADPLSLVNISIMVNRDRKQFFTKLADFEKNQSWTGELRKKIAVPVDVNAIPDDVPSVIVLEFPPSTPPFYISPVSLSFDSSPGNYTHAPARYRRTQESDLVCAYLDIPGAAGLSNMQATSDEATGAFALSGVFPLPGDDFRGRVLIPVEQLTAAAIWPAAEVILELSHHAEASSGVVNAEVGIFPVDVAGHPLASPACERRATVRNLVLSRRVTLSFPRADESMCGHAIVLDFESFRGAGEIRLSCTVRAAAEDAPDAIKVEAKVSGAPEANDIPAVFDGLHYLSQIGIDPSELKELSLEEIQSATWSLYDRSGYTGFAPHPLFSPSWYETQLAADGRQPLPGTRNLLVDYSTRTDRSSPHPLIDEDYVNLQYRSLYDIPVESRSAIEILTTSDDFRIDPHRLFSTMDVAKALNIPPRSRKVAEVLLHYLSDKSAWIVPPSPLFRPERIDGKNECPLLAYLRDEALWEQSPHPLFDPAFFASQPNAGQKPGMAPLAAYLAANVKERVNPHPQFDTHYYALQFPEIWDGKISALEHYVRTGAGNPSPKFQKRYYIAAHPERALSTSFFTEGDNGIASFGESKYDAPRDMLVAPTPRSPVIVQMTPQKPRNPYYTQLPIAFKEAGWDFRFATDVDAMVDFAKKRKGLMFWFHQLEPFYHVPGNDLVTKSRMVALAKNLSAMRESGNTVIHTWHNQIPYDARHLDADYELYFKLDEILSLIVTHAEHAVPWIRQFCPTVPIHVTPHHGLTHHFNTFVDKQVARKILKLPQDALIFHHFGEIKPYKNIGLLLRAWRRFRDDNQYGNAFLMLTGQWKHHDSEFREASSLSDLMLVDKVLNDEELSLYIAAADACVFTHKSVWASGACATAISFGKPIIVPTETGLSRIYVDEENGFVFPNNDAEGLVRAMNRMCASTLAPHMEFMNRSLAEEGHPFRLQERYARLFETLCSAKGK